MIVIVDYGMGNLRSVYNAFETQGYTVSVSDSTQTIENAGGLVLPGVGAFGDCIKNLQKKGLLETVKSFISSGRPFLGICLGLQALFNESEEAPGIRGLGVFKGRVRKFSSFSPQKLKVPQIGWNQIEFDPKITVLKNIPQKSWFYFVHSYYVEPEDEDLKIIRSDYGIEFTAAVEKDNVFACQFHPEKSGESGLKIIRNFAELSNSRQPLTGERKIPLP